MMAIEHTRSDDTSSIDPRPSKRARRGAVSVALQEEEDFIADAPAYMLRHLNVSPMFDAEEQILRLKTLLTNHAFFSTLCPRVNEVLFKEFVLERYSEGAVLCREGLSEDKFIVMESGEAETASASDEKKRDILREGDCFGDIALLQPAPNPVSVQALSPCSVWTIDGCLLRYLVNAKHVEQYEIMKRFYRQSMQWLQAHKQSDFVFLLDGSSLLQFRAGEVILQPGTRLDAAYLIKEGSAGEYDGDRLVREVRENGCLGRACLSEVVSGARPALPHRVACLSDVCEIVVVQMTVFERFPDLLAILLERSAKAEADGDVQMQTGATNDV